MEEVAEEEFCARVPNSRDPDPVSDHRHESDFPKAVFFPCTDFSEITEEPTKISKTEKSLKWQELKIKKR